MKAKIDFSEVNKNMTKLLRNINKNTAVYVSQFAAEWVLGLAQEKAPVDQGRLGASANTQRTGDTIEFGFNTEYAAVQDQGFEGETIKPRLKRSLYIPITDKGKRYHTLGANPSTEGLVYGVDYILKKQVHVPNKSYGAKKGPNKYFSETLERNKNKIFEVIRDRLQDLIDKQL